MSIRYMGTKRHIAHRVRCMAERVSPKGKVLDLFSGMGCVTEHMAGFRSVVTNDALAFTAVFSRARFTTTNQRMTVARAIERIRDPYREHLDTLFRRHRSQVKSEAQALERDRASLAAYISEARHAANSPSVATEAMKAANATGPDHYCMTTLYFSAGYFGIRQAIQLDALRCAIDTLEEVDHDRDWLLASWLSAAATVANAPGHTAQYLKPNSDAAYKRIRRYWRRNVWEEFQNHLVNLKPVGTVAWRKKNRAEVSDAVDLLRGDRLGRIGLVYADPPYTRDQYSRYYHVYETMLMYDFPTANGEGRVRPNDERVTSSFSRKTQVVDAFKDLFDAVADLNVPLILSYPSAGLLSEAGGSVPVLASRRFSIEAAETFAAHHSTLGASQGSKTKLATENLYVCRPT